MIAIKFQQAHPDDRSQSRGKTQSAISIYKFQSRILQYVDCYKLSLINFHFTNTTQYSFVILSP